MLILYSLILSFIHSFIHSIFILFVKIYKTNPPADTAATGGYKKFKKYLYVYSEKRYCSFLMGLQGGFTTVKSDSEEDIGDPYYVFTYVLRRDSHTSLTRKTSTI